MKDEQKKQLVTQLIEQNNNQINFTANEVCEILKISRAKLSRLQKECKISFRKDNSSKNGAVRFHAEHIIDFQITHVVIAYKG